MPPNSFCEWMAGSNVKRSKSKPSSKRPVLSISLDTDDETDTDMISLTYPRTSSTPAQRKQVRFADAPKGALKDPSANFSADQESEVSTESNDTSDDGSTTDESDEMLSKFSYAECTLGRRELKILKQTKGKKNKSKKAKADSSEDTSEDETPATETKRKGKGKKKPNAESSEDTTEDTSEDEATAAVLAKHKAKKAKEAEQKKAKASQKSKGQDGYAKGKSKGKGKGKKAKQKSDTESEDVETDTEDETGTETEPESEAASEASSSEEGEVFEIIRKKKNNNNNKQSSKSKQNKKSQEKGGKEKSGKGKGGKDGKKDKSGGKGGEQGTEKKGNDAGDSDRDQPSHRYPYPPYPNMRAPDPNLHPQAHVVRVEHAVESPYDPRPNAFYDNGNGVMRVYHGPFYGNPHSTLYPRHVYKDDSNSPIKTPHPLNNPWYNGYVYDDHGRPMPSHHDPTRKPGKAGHQQGGGPPPAGGPSDWFQGWGTVTADDDKGNNNTSAQKNKKKSPPVPQMPPVPEYTVNANVFKRALENTLSPPMRSNNLFPSIESPEHARSDGSRGVSDKSKGTGASSRAARQADWTDLWNTDINPPRDPSPPPRISSSNHHHRSSTKNKHDDSGRSKSERKARFADSSDHVFRDIDEIIKRDQERLKASEERWANLSRSSKERSSDKSGSAGRESKEPSPEKDNWGGDSWGNTNNKTTTDDWGTTTNTNVNTGGDTWGADDWGNSGNTAGVDTTWGDGANDSGDNGHNAISQAADWDWGNDNTNNEETNNAQAKNGSGKSPPLLSLLSHVYCHLFLACLLPPALWYDRTRSLVFTPTPPSFVPPITYAYLLPT